MTAPTILAVMDTPDSAAACLRAAADAAAAFASAKIEALFVRMDPASSLELPEVVTGRYEQAINARSAEQGAALRAAFDAWAESTRPANAIWIEVDAVPAAAIAERGALASLVVLAQPSAGARPAAAGGFDAALFATGKPVLVVPPGDGAPFGRHLAVGWRDVPATRRCLAALRPWLLAAATVSVIAVTHGDVPQPPDWNAANLPAAATFRSVRPAGRPDGELLLQEAEALGADGLAIGAYRQGRLVERLVGGVTADVLRLAKIPVLMQV
jgi:hypothetical protein